MKKIFGPKANDQIEAVTALQKWFMQLENATA